MPADVSRLRAALEQWGPAVAQEIGRETASLAARDPQTPRGREAHGGPKLADSFESQVTAQGVRSTVSLRNTAPQATFTDKGTPGPIFPRHAKALRFTIGGQTVFAAHVSGITAQRWFVPVVERSFRSAVPFAARAVPF